MTSLLTLYQSILIPIIEDWITDEDLCCLDVSVGDRSQRNYFLSVLAKCNLTTIDNGGDRYRFSDWMKWMVLRGIHTKGICVSLRNLNSIEPILLKNSCLKVLRAEVNDSSDILSATKNGVETLVLHSFSTNNATIEALLESHLPLKRLDISNCYGLTSAIIPKIIDLTSKLESVVIPLYLVLHAGKFLENRNFSDCSKHLQEATKGCDINGALELRVDSARIVSLEIRSEKYTPERICAKFPYLRRFESSIGSLEPFIFFSSRLTSLRLSYCDLNEVELLNCLKNLRLLKSLYSSIKTLTDATMIHLTKYCLELEDLAAFNCNISDFGVMKVLYGCKKLVMLQVPEETISEEVLQYVSKRSTKLQLNADQIWVKHDDKRKGLTVVISKNNLKASILCSLFKQCPGLRKVGLHVDSVLDFIVESMVDWCPLLHTVKISDSKITSDALVSLAKCPHLKHLTVCDLNHLNDEILDLLMHNKSNDFKLCLPGCSGQLSAKYHDLTKVNSFSDEG